jgi:hypothetical protein
LSNLRTEDAFEYNMFVDSQGRPIGVNIPNSEHRCGPLSTVEECKDGGWATFNHPAPLGDQGACVAYGNHWERITLLVPEDPTPGSLTGNRDSRGGDLMKTGDRAPRLTVASPGSSIYTCLAA